MRDPETGKYVAPTEAGRRQQYLDKMTGGAEVITLRQLVERCLEDDPDKRPPIQEVKEKIEPMVVSVLFHTINQVHCQKILDKGNLVLLAM